MIIDDLSDIVSKIFLKSAFTFLFVYVPSMYMCLSCLSGMYRCMYKYSEPSYNGVFAPQPRPTPPSTRDVRRKAQARRGLKLNLQKCPNSSFLLMYKTVLIIYIIFEEARWHWSRDNVTELILIKTCHFSMWLGYKKVFSIALTALVPDKNITEPTIVHDKRFQCTLMK